MVHLPLYCVVSFARAADRLFFADFRKVPVEGPVFVVATPRSGTTFLHHLLALDEQNFTHQKLYQTIFPSIVTNRLFGLFSRSRTTPPGSQSWGTQILERVFSHWEGIHSVRPDQEEEDESLFVYSLYTPALYLIMPFIERMPHLKNTDQASSRIVRKMARDYRRTVQRHLYTDGLNVQGKARLLVVKNVLLPSRLQMTQQAFPRARFIRLVRDPHSAIPSAMNLFYSTWAVHSPDLPQDGAETRALFEMFVSHFRRLHELAGADSSGQVLTVKFEELIADPVSEVRKIYGFLGLSFGEEQEKALAAAVSVPARFKSRHEYSLEEFGLSKQDISTQLFDIVGELGYDSAEGAKGTGDTPGHAA
jgi:hypothetical protein